MNYLLNIFGFIWRAERKAMWRGIVMMILVLCMGAALLGLSGWFILATGTAGLATGAAGMAASGMNVGLPSAAVRALAIGRTISRYGERLLTHDATLRALARLRVLLLKSFSAMPYLKMQRFRGTEILNRLTTDVDALDGIALRLVIPFMAGIMVFILGFGLICWLTGFWLAFSVIGGMVLGVIVAFWLSLRRARQPARFAGFAKQAFRVRLIDLLRGQIALVLAGQLQTATDSALKADQQMRDARLKMAKVERLASFTLAMSATIAAGLALYLGAELVRNGKLDVALAAFGFFIALGLGEVILSLQKGMAELGGMVDAARRVSERLETSSECIAPEHLVLMSEQTPLQINNLQVTAPGRDDVLLAKNVNLSVKAGETVGLVGKSGSGKSSMLAMLAGLTPPKQGSILIYGHDIRKWPEAQLRHHMGFLLQRSALMSGSIRENLAMAEPEASQEFMNDILQKMALSKVLSPQGGLSAKLGEAGSGLSGGEQRRMALAQVLIRQPDILLLDEPCEGLDNKTAALVLKGIRQICPDAAILMASHRSVEVEWCDRLYQFS